MAGEIDPQYAARFRRGYLPESDVAAPVSPDGAEDPPDPSALEESRPRRAPGVVLLVLAVGFAALAAGGVAWEVLDGAFRVAPVPDPLAALRVVARAGPGPLAVAVAVAVPGALALLGLSRRAVVVASAALASVFLVLVAQGATELARLGSLTMQGPVSSGGIPLPGPALAVYFQRVQLIAVLDRLLPWLLLGGVLEVVAAVFLAGILSSRRPA